MVKKKKEVSIYDLINLSCVTLRLLMSFFFVCVNGKPIQKKKKTRRREKKDRKKKTHRNRQTLAIYPHHRLLFSPLKVNEG